MGEFFTSLVVGVSVLVSAALGPFMGRDASSTPRQMPPKERATASTTVAVPSAAMIACVGTAVNTRESSLIAGQETLSASINSAYEARAGALKTAYAQTSAEGVRSSVKSAWQKFQSSTKSAQTAWRSTSKRAWDAYNSAVKSCKAPSTITDTANTTLEVTGM